jgi:hypothetical protein
VAVPPRVVVVGVDHDLARDGVARHFAVAAHGNRYDDHLAEARRVRDRRCLPPFAELLESEPNVWTLLTNPARLRLHRDFDAGGDDPGVPRLVAAAPPGRGGGVVDGGRGQRREDVGFGAERPRREQSLRLDECRRPKSSSRADGHLVPTCQRLERARRANPPLGYLLNCALALGQI